MRIGSLAGLLAGGLGVCLATLAPVEARATTLLQMTVEDTVAAADAVVRGTVVAREDGTWRDGKGNEFVVTYISVAVDHAYMGEGVPATVRYVIPGGTAPNGDTVSVPSGFPNERIGTDVLLMIEDTPIANTYAVTGAAQGRYYVTESNTGRATASRMPVDAQLVDRATGKAIDAAGTGALMPLAQLEERIAAAAAKAGRAYHEPKRTDSDDDPPPGPPEIIACPDESDDDDSTDATPTTANAPAEVAP